MAFVATSLAPLHSRVARTQAPLRQAATAFLPSPGLTYMKTLPGISAPLGFFDPAGLTLSPTFSVSEAKRFREAEITHGRVSMLAALGWTVQEQFHPLFGGNVTGPAVYHFQKIQEKWPSFWLVVLFAIGIAESVRIADGWNNPRVKVADQLKESYEPGDIGFDPLGLYPTAPKAQYDLKTRELNNGRLAMIAVAGFAAQEKVNEVPILNELRNRGFPVPFIKEVVEKVAADVSTAQSVAKGASDAALGAADSVTGALAASGETLQSQVMPKMQM